MFSILVEEDVKFGPSKAAFYEERQGINQLDTFFIATPTNFMQYTILENDTVIEETSVPINYADTKKHKLSTVNTNKAVYVQDITLNYQNRHSTTNPIDTQRYSFDSLANPKSINTTSHIIGYLSDDDIVFNNKHTQKLYSMSGINFALKDIVFDDWYYIGIAETPYYIVLSDYVARKIELFNNTGKIVA